ncbi:SRPBCC family protein [Phaeacidiphilus oryzae]|uniref:SRPBCC family protein n=1 Tax=Phaeacidiphilus oryzae TaxID=348818 RepID=UPI0005689FF4|nr:SRPBCC family protein [Phaeacidiphilus oryzae]
MASKDQRDNAQDGGSALDRVREGIVSYLGAGAQHLTDKAGDKVSDLADRLTDAADNGGVLGGAGGRILRGDSPLKALVSEQAKSIKDPIVEKTKGLFGGGGNGGDGGGGNGGGGGGGKGQSGDTKVTNIVETVDIGLPVRTVYDHWTQYEKFSTFTKGVRSVSQSDETESDWKVKVGPSTRGWKATVQEQVPDERIVWTSEGAKGSTRGSITFHELAPNLTRIVVVVEYYPAGFFEKTGNLWRAQGRRLRLDLKHFARYVTLGADEEVEGWRGEIRDGEVVRSHEEAMEDEESEAEEDEEPEEDEDEEDEGEEDEYDDEYGDEEDPDEYDEDEYDEEAEDDDEYGDEYGDEEDPDDYDEDEYDEEAEDEGEDDEEDEEDADAEEYDDEEEEE